MREAVVELEVKVVELIAKLLVALHKRLQHPVDVGGARREVERCAILHDRPFQLHPTGEQTQRRRSVKVVHVTILRPHVDDR